MKVTLIVAHDYDSKRKVGFHYWADYLVANGHEVDYVSVGKSYLSKLFGRPIPSVRNQWVKLSERLNVYNWVSWIHPCLNHRFLNPFLLPIFKLIPHQFGKGNLQRLAASDVLIVESGIGLALIPLIKQLNGNIKIIYEASDRLKTVGAHPYVLSAELQALESFDLIRVPAKVMLGDFSTHAPIVYIPQGIDKTEFDKTHTNPYSTGKNVISVGDMLFDQHVITQFANAFPEWTFHLFGRNAKLTDKLKNVIEYGECHFASIVPYMKFADIGLAPYRNALNCEYLSQSSLKLLQYAYSSLPIVAPEFASGNNSYVFGYKDLASANEAFTKAMMFNKQASEKPVIYSWDNVLDEMLNLIGSKAR